MADNNATPTATRPLGGEKPIKPGEHPETAPSAKLPPPNDASGTVDLQTLPADVRKAWIDHMVNGFRHNEEMFQRTLAAFLQPYYLTLWMYGALFVLGILLVLTAVVMGLRNTQPVVTIVFAGLGTAAFLAFFIRQPLQALEENLEFITWLGVAFNTYWLRLMYMTNAKSIQQDLKAASDDYIETVEHLILTHAKMRSKRPGSQLANTPSTEAQPQATGAIPHE